MLPLLKLYVPSFLTQRNIEMHRGIIFCTFINNVLKKIKVFTSVHLKWTTESLYFLFYKSHIKWMPFRTNPEKDITQNNLLKQEFLYS